MDLNYLLSRHQTSLMLAERATCIPSRRSHEALATGYASRVNGFYDNVGASARALSLHEMAA